MTRIQKALLASCLAIAVVVLTGIVALFTLPTLQDALFRRIAHNNFSGQRDDLVNDKALRVAICGSGSPMPDPDRSPACYLVFAGGKIFAVDAGPGSWELVMRWHIPMERVGVVFLTHFHSDHIGDLGEANLQTWVAGRPAPLVVYGGPGVEKVVAGFVEAYSLDSDHRIAHHGADFLKPDLGVMQARRIANADGSPLTGMQSMVVYRDGGVTVMAFAVDHGPVIPAYGYRFDYRGRSIVFSGDTSKSANLVRVAKGADLLIHDAMLKDVVRMMNEEALANGRLRVAKILHDILSYHSSPRDAAETARDAGVPHLVLSHLIPPIPGWLGSHRFLRDAAMPDVDERVAYDGMLIELPVNSKDMKVSDLGH